jgi:O-antigen/teichoic acid export membrane protein
MIGRYFLVMAINTGLTFARGLVLAALLPVEDFGLYVTFMAIGLFLSVLLSLGDIEATIKGFPRAQAAGNPQHILATSRHLTTRLSQRMLAAAAILIPLSYLLTRDAHLTLLFALGIAAALPAALLGLLASVARAVPDLMMLAKSALLRTALALALSCAGAWVFGAAGALAGEVAAAALAVLYAKTIYAELARPASPAQAPAAAPQATGGLWLLAASLVVSALVYLDRSFVAFALGVEEAGRFGLLMIFVTGANALVGQAVQKVGPDLIRAQHQGVGVSQQLRLLRPWLIAFAGVILGLVFAGFLALSMPWTAAFLQKFRIGAAEILLAGGLGLLQVGTVFDWMLISHNRERQVLLAAIAFAAALLLPALIGLYSGLSLQGILMIMIAARLAQIAVQSVLISRPKM